MANRPNTTSVASKAQYSATVLNGNFELLEDASENSLGRGGTSESNNSMQGDLDLDTHRVIHVGDPVEDLDAVNKRTVDNEVANLNAAFTHPNQSTLDKITESNGLPLWDGSAWPGGTGVVTIDSNIDGETPWSLINFDSNIDRDLDGQTPWDLIGA